MKIIIAGAYAIGTHLARLLSRNDQDVVLIDEDEERLNNIGSDYDLMTMHASPTSVKALKDAGAGHADLYIGVTPDENMNMNSCILAKALGVKKTVAKVNNYEFVSPDMNGIFNKVGIDSIVYPENLAAHDIVKRNGLYCVIAKEGDTYSKIADEFSMRARRLTSFNDISWRKRNNEIAAGSIVYLEEKNDAAQSTAPSTYVTRTGDTSHKIAQQFGIKLKPLCKMNRLSTSNSHRSLKPGVKLRLR